MAFGDAGAYERVSGVASGELDPADPRNRGIVNLDKAPKNAAGKVEYTVDFALESPINIAVDLRRLGELAPEHRGIELHRRQEIVVASFEFS